MLGSGLEGPCYKVETWVGRLCNNISLYSPQPWTACIPPTSKDSHLLLACIFLHGCPLVPPAWPCAPLRSSHPCPPARSHMDSTLIPPHGFPPLHDCHTFPSHSHGHMPTHTDTWIPTCTDTWMPTRTDTWMPTPSSSHLLPAHLAWVPLISPAQTHAHSHGHIPTHTDTCPLALIAFITSTPTCVSPHRYVSSPCMDSHPLILVSPTTHLHAHPWVPPYQPCSPLCSLHPCPPTCPCTDMSHLPTQRPAPSSLLHLPSTHLAQMPLISPAWIPPS